MLTLPTKSKHSFIHQIQVAFLVFVFLLENTESLDWKRSETCLSDYYIYRLYPDIDIRRENIQREPNKI